MTITIKTYNDFLGTMIRKIIANSPVNDVNVGSVILDILEAAATVDFENNSAILSVLDLLSIDALKNNDLDARASDFGLSRITAQRSTGSVKLYDTAITKRSTGLYAVKPPPIAGSTTLFVNDASAWAPTGALFIGRGTSSFEGPINYTSIVNNGSFFTINLASALQKDHLASDSVVDKQGTTDRLIAAGTILRIPPNNQLPEVTFRILRDAVIAAGEDSIDGVPIVSEIAGSQANAGIGTIAQFMSLPFTTAAVTNTTALSDGRDVETDAELRERIKAYAGLLARGTKDAILSAVIGVSDPTDNTQVESAVITEPPVIGEPSILYLDNGSGFQPSYLGQSVDVLLSNATGDEEFLQLANYPLPRPQVVNTADGPYALANNMVFRVSVDNVEESVTFSTAEFANIAAATLPEIVIAINSQATTFKCRLTANSTRLLVYTNSFSAEEIKVSELKPSDDATLFANSILKFPVTIASYIRLYQNSTLLKERSTAATLTTLPYSQWGILAYGGDIVLSVDHTPPQDAGFTASDFNGLPLAALTVDDWATAFNAKFAGVTATTTSSGALQLVSNKIGSKSALTVLGGTYLSNLFTNEPTVSVGQDSDFNLNRQTGNLRIKTKILPGDVIEAGTADAKGNVISTKTSSGNYNLDIDGSLRPAELVVVPDSLTAAPRSRMSIAIGTTITISDQGSNVMRILSSSLVAFDSLEPRDFIYIANRGDIDGTGSGTWVDLASCGLYKIIDKGQHTTAGVDTYVDVKNLNIVPGTYAVLASQDVQAFHATTYPQLWKGKFLTTPALSTIQSVVTSLNTTLLNSKATIFKTSAIKLTSTTELNGSIATPVSIGNAAGLFPTAGSAQLGNPPQIANKIPDKDFFGLIKRTPPSDSNVFLGRWIYDSVNGALTSNFTPSSNFVLDPYSEELRAVGTLTTANTRQDDTVMLSNGSNKGQFRYIKDLLAGDGVGTQQNIPRTLMDHTVGDEVTVFKPLTFSPDDNIVVIMDQNPSLNTIDIPFSRTGRISSLFPPTNTAFNAYDEDNEPGVTFSNIPAWGTAQNGTDFRDYAVWFRARNWYVSGGAGSGGAQLILRAAEYGPQGENISFKLDYPITPNQTPLFSFTNNPSGTVAQYVFGSGPTRSLGISSGLQFNVSSLGSNNYRLTFTGPINLTSVVIGDILGIGPSAGVSTFNSGSYRIFNKGLSTLDIYNPNATVTGVGSQEVIHVNTVADVLGTEAQHTIDTVAEASIPQGSYFTLYDDIGMVAFWFDKNDTGIPAPTVVGAYRYVEIPTILTGDTAAQVASKVALIVNSDSRFTATSLLTQVTVVNRFVGPVTAGSAGTSGFTVIQAVPGVAADSLDGKYFLMQDAAGSVAVWYNVSGNTSQPLHGANRAIQVTTVAFGDSANTVATKTAVVIAGDSAYASATVIGNQITVTDAVVGGRPVPNPGTSGFTLSVFHSGSNASPETINVTNAFNIYPLQLNSVLSISNTINASAIMTAVVVGSTGTLINFATRDEVYTPAGPGNYSTSLSYGHNPDPLSGMNTSVKLYDSMSWVKVFSNSSPNFIMKTSFLLQGAAPSAYDAGTVPNPGITDLGELFKLIPTTLYNVYHQMTQKALSQLPLVASVDISDNIRKVQIKSKTLGSLGAVEIVGGRANLAESHILGDGQEIDFSGSRFLQLKTAAFPATYNIGDEIIIQNDNPSKRLARTSATDTVNVIPTGSNNVNYVYNPKAINMTQYVRWTVTDVSSSYGRAGTGTVWRWTHSDGGSQFNVLDKTIGSVSPQVNDEIAAGITHTTALKHVVIAAGSVSTFQNFTLEIASLPTQADYYTFKSASGATFAAWFSVNGNVTTPTGASYTAAATKIMVSILSSDTENQVLSKLAIALNANATFLSNFTGLQQDGADLVNVAAGDLLNSYGIFSNSWPAGNVSNQPGSLKVSGFPIIAVNTVGGYIDILNPNGRVMSNLVIGSTGHVAINPTPSIKWNLKNGAKIVIQSIVVSSGTATATTLTPHFLSQGDSAVIDDNTLAGTVTVATVPGFNQFTFSTIAVDGTYSNGNVISSTKTVTKYRIEALTINNLYRLRHMSGSSPEFTDCGVAVGDFLVISGTTFASNNSGRFKVLNVSNDSITFTNPQASEELDTLKLFNNLNLSAIWTANANVVSGAAGTFKNVSVGDWVKKTNDDDDLYVQVLSMNASPSSATSMTLGSNYRGTSGVSIGDAFDQRNDAGAGRLLRGLDDIQVFEGDSVIVNDTLFVENLVSPTWFNVLNVGTFSITDWGSEATNYAPYINIVNANGSSQSGVQLAFEPLGFYIIESKDDKFYTYGQVAHQMIDEFNVNRRVFYITPPDRIYKLAQANATKIASAGKLGFSADVVNGTDGYLYYIGLMQKVQRIVDGFAPDSVNYPGRRAIGGIIESLPPLIRRVKISLILSTNEGVNLNEIGNDISSTIIKYVNGLGVGQSVILSEIIVLVMAVRGVMSVTFTTPVPSTELIPIADNEKAFIEPIDISLSS